MKNLKIENENKTVYYIEPIIPQPRVEGGPCAHPGCFSHVSHRCEGCGRIGGLKFPHCHRNIGEYIKPLGRIKKILEVPCCVQSIQHEIWLDIMPKHIPDYIPFWFNRNFSKPIPIKCENCYGKGYTIPVADFESAHYVSGKSECQECGGDGIDYWATFWYDEESFLIELDSHNSVFHENLIINHNTNKYEWHVNDYINKELKPIFDPWCWIYKLCS
jgi:hypothetical protein